MTQDKWNHFLELPEQEQALFLLRVSKKAFPSLSDFPELALKIERYWSLAELVLGGDYSHHKELRRFLNDNEGDEDFGAYFYIGYDNKVFCAGLDLVAYACGFIARFTAPAAGVTVLSDPILEAVPEIYTYFKEKCEFLGITP